MRFGHFIRRFRPKLPHLPGGVVPPVNRINPGKIGGRWADIQDRIKAQADHWGRARLQAGNTGGMQIRKDLVVIPPGSSSAKQAFLMDGGSLLLGDDEEDSGTSWADVFGNLTSALAPAVGAAAGMYVNKALGQTAKNTGVAVPRGTMVPGPNGTMIPYTPPSTFGSFQPYLIPAALGLIAFLVLRRK